MNGFIEVTNEHTCRRVLIAVDEIAMVGSCSGRNASFISMRTNKEDMTVSDTYQAIKDAITKAKESR